MPKAETCTLTHSIKVSVNKTAFLTPGDITLDFKTDIELEDSDIGLLKKVQSEYESALDGQVKNQAAALNTWLSEQDGKLATMVKEVQALGDSVPGTPGEAKKYADVLKKQEALAKSVDKLPDEWSKIVQDWATNVREQQGLVAVKVAVKNARLKAFSDKSVRVRAGQAIKVTLVVAAVVLGVVSIVLTAGAATPVVIALAAAGLALSSAASIATTGKSIWDNLTIEKKLMANIEKDIDTLKAALDEASTSKGKFASHVTELDRLMKIRQDQIKELTADTKKYSALANGYKDDLAKLKSQATFNSGDIAKKQKAIDTVTKELDAVTAQIKKLETDNAKAKSLLDSMSGMVGDLGKLSTQAPNTIRGNLKERVTSLEGVADIANSGGGLVGGVGGLC